MTEQKEPAPKKDKKNFKVAKKSELDAKDAAEVQAVQEGAADQKASPIDVYVLLCFYGEEGALATPGARLTGRSATGKICGLFRSYDDAKKASRPLSKEPHFIKSRIEQHHLG